MSLLDRVADLADDSRRSSGSWRAQLEVINPTLYAELCDVVDRWLAKDISVRRKFSSQTGLEKFVGKVIAEAGMPRQKTQIRLFVNERGFLRGE